jgi:hypothetical protein
MLRLCVPPHPVALANHLKRDLLGRGGGDFPAGEVVSRGVLKGVPRDRQRVGYVRGCDGQRDRHPDVVCLPAMLGGDLGRSGGRVGRGKLEPARVVPQARRPPRRGTVSRTE